LPGVFKLTSVTVFLSGNESYFTQPKLCRPAYNWSKATVVFSLFAECLSRLLSLSSWIPSVALIMCADRLLCST